ncbi:hypothetical protein AVEN_102553-1 [Araneus ventricosus]|uniref:HAT C-terminal dimerisation domain-containing protein n=1 Tax=Araneus ventricosus TaxID=182803 RepID=A0A4Y2BLC4_ARAVE|nr:hypothetical protein AVEN_102553-1 [Araneus ventricosus]
MDPKASRDLTSLRPGISHYSRLPVQRRVMQLVLLKNGRKPLKNYAYLIKLTQWIFLTLPVTVATGERSFSKLKLIETYLRSSMSQERLVGLVTIPIDLQNIDIENTMQDFADKKARNLIM